MNFLDSSTKQDEKQIIDNLLYKFVNNRCDLMVEFINFTVKDILDFVEYVQQNENLKMKESEILLYTIYQWRDTYHWYYGNEEKRINLKEDTLTKYKNVNIC